MKELIKDIKYNRHPKEVFSLLYLLDNSKFHIVSGDETYIYLDNVFILFQIYKDRILCECDYINNFLSEKYGIIYKIGDSVKYINEAIKLSNYSNCKITII